MPMRPGEVISSFLAPAPASVKWDADSTYLTELFWGFDERFMGSAMKTANYIKSIYEGFSFIIWVVPGPVYTEVTGTFYN
jgi:hypothetical protein